MEKEEFEFSAVVPILSLVWVPVFLYLTLSLLTRGVLHYSVLSISLNLFFIALMIRCIRITYLMLKRKPALILTKEGITITERGDFIDWEDVKDVYMTSRALLPTYFRIYYVTIRVREPEKYLKMIKNPFMRYYRWYTRNWRESSFEANLVFVKGNDEEIYQEILKYYQHNRLYFRIP